MHQYISSKVCNNIFVLMRISNKSMYLTLLNFLTLFTNIIHLILLKYSIKTILNTFIRI